MISEVRVVCDKAARHSRKHPTVAVAKFAYTKRVGTPRWQVVDSARRQSGTVRTRGWFGARLTKDGGVVTSDVYTGEPLRYVQVLRCGRCGDNVPFASEDQFFMVLDVLAAHGVFVVTLPQVRAIYEELRRDTPNLIPSS